MILTAYPLLRARPGGGVLRIDCLLLQNRLLSACRVLK
ncbi:hypothetical protein ASZ90_010203 [hydrocarbon metagenome]|uniref:Uncharacterized protein n=1 Tax=hydrocarbon metagenome TaxID=938273 RepID=A0A0W8FGQ1_9ZZZZ